MEEHFNENYMESDKFPKSTFKGSISNIKDVNFAKDGTYKVSTAGTLTMHGVSKQVTIPATITIKGGKISASSTFMVLLSDYNIAIPSVVKDKIAKDIKITVNCDYELYVKP
jgi:polyisoprenoid-binding protein YceI